MKVLQTIAGFGALYGGIATCCTLQIYTPHFYVI